MRSFRFIFFLLTLGLALYARALPVNVLATGDMHGWLEAQQVNGQTLGGAAEMLAYWKRVEGYAPERFLLLGCGDTATGPALSTVFQNDPVIAVMNLMGYDACALGNHEFDYGLASLERWRKDATFPFLAGNLVKADGAPADLPPFVINDEQGVKVAVIGLITSDVAAIAGTGWHRATPYAAALRKWVPEARAQGAQVVIVAAHIPLEPLMQLARQVADLKIPLMLGGHNHELGQMKVGDTWVVGTGEWWKSYSRINLDYNPQTGSTVVLAANQVWLQQQNAPADPAVKAEIDRWKARMDEGFNKPVGYTAAGIRRPVGIYNFIIDCWLAQDQTADIALSNIGGFRQNIAPGAVTKSTIIGVMPFTNSLLRMAVTGNRLLAFLPKDGNIGMAGLRFAGGQYVVLKTGQPIDPAATYRVLINDYFFNGSAVLKAADPAPVIVCADWRQFVFDWLAAHPTDKDRPLEGLLDLKSRWDAPAK